jgi:hypothetical protein
MGSYRQLTDLLLALVGWPRRFRRAGPISFPSSWASAFGIASLGLDI